MPIVSSVSVVDDYVQQSGEKYVSELHTDDLGIIRRVGPYLAASDFDVAARMVSRATEINEQLAQEEVAQVIGEG